jgi:DNA helicase II / ATP-dependent DNA helicase PcrA
MTDQLDKDQQTCVNAVDGVYIIFAGPGSGKTRVTVERYIHLLELGISPDDILSLTFTAEAATEMASRSGATNSKKIFRTFHSFVLDLIQNERAKLSFTLKPPILPVEFEDYELRAKLVKRYPLVRRVDDLKEYISNQKRLGITPDAAIASENGIGQFFAQAYRDYEQTSTKEGWLDFDSLMMEAVQLLESSAEVRARYAKKYIQVDEAQDTDPTQLRLLKALFLGNIFFVGDQNQSIYEWRGASPNIMSDIPQIFPGAKILYLGTNYRSTGALVEFFKEILPVDNGLASHMRTNNPIGEPPTFVHYADDYQEAIQILRRVTDHTNTAIIARTNRQLFRFQQACFNANIKSKILGKKAFWEQNEVKQLLSLAKSTKFPPEYTAPMILKALTIQHRLLEKYRFSGNPLDSDPADNINSLYKLSAKYTSITDFLDFIRRLTYGSKSNNTPCLTLSTVHQAKGREWKHVFLTGVTEGILPHHKANHPEEKRIFFVGASRAAQNLHISFYKQPSMFLNNYRDRIVKYVPEVINGEPRVG